MDRRDTVLALLALGAAPLAAEAQPATTVARIGYLATNPASSPHVYASLPSSKGCVTSVTSRAATS